MFIGGVIYLFFRSSHLKMFGWMANSGVKPFIDTIRLKLFSYQMCLPKWLIFSLPDGLWVYSFTSSILIFWKGELTFWAYIPLMIGAGSEIGQWFHLFPGTFDFLDFFLEFLGLIISFTLNKKKTKP